MYVVYVVLIYTLYIEYINRAKINRINAHRARKWKLSAYITYKTYNGNENACGTTGFADRKMYVAENRTYNSVQQKAEGSDEMPKTLIAIPCMSKVDTDFMTSLLAMERLPDTHYSFLTGSLVYDSRNTISVNAITNEYDRLLMIDSDMVFQPDTLKRLSEDMDRGIDYVSALYFSRRPPIKPMIYKRLGIKVENGMDCADTEIYYDYPQDALFRVQGAGTACVMISVKLIKAVWDVFGPAFVPLSCMGEDLSFCHRVNQLGVPMYCDSRIKIGHIGNVIYNEEMYKLQQERMNAT